MVEGELYDATGKYVAGSIHQQVWRRRLIPPFANIHIGYPRNIISYSDKDFDRSDDPYFHGESQLVTFHPYCSSGAYPNDPVDLSISWLEWRFLELIQPIYDKFHGGV